VSAKKLPKIAQKIEKIKKNRIDSFCFLKRLFALKNGGKVKKEY
jgi:hypothetical protein